MAAYLRPILRLFRRRQAVDAQADHREHADQTDRPAYAFHRIADHRRQTGERHQRRDARAAQRRANRDPILVFAALLNIVGSFLFCQLIPSSAARRRVQLFKSLAAHPSGDIREIVLRPLQSRFLVHSLVSQRVISVEHLPKQVHAIQIRHRLALKILRLFKDIPLERQLDLFARNGGISARHYTSPLAIVLMISPAIIIPTTGGTKLTLPGAWRPLLSSATIFSGSSVENTTR